MSTLSGGKTEPPEPPFEGEGNTERLNFRITKSMKDQLKVLTEFEMAGSVGELARGVLREHIKATTNTVRYKLWLERIEKEKHRA